MHRHSGYHSIFLQKSGALILLLVLLCSLLPVSGAAEEPEDPIPGEELFQIRENPSADEPTAFTPMVTEEQVQAKLAALTEALDGKYFTVNQKACNMSFQGGHSCSNCNMESVVRTEWLQDTVGLVPANLYHSGTFIHYYYGGTYTRGWSCCGFANFAGWFVFANNASDDVTFSQLATGRYNAATMAQARPGDIIRLGGAANSGSGWHSALVLSVEDNGVRVLDSNSNDSGTAGNCMVQDHLIKYGGSYSYVTISRCDKYLLSRELTPVTFYATCSFDERLAVNYYVPESNLTGYDNVELKVIFENRKGSVSTLTAPQYISGVSTTYNGTACRKFIFSGVSAPEVGNRIYTVLCAEKNGVPYRSREINYSISDYCYNMLKDGSGADDSLKKLVVNVLNYSAAAQIYFDVDPDNLVNSRLTDAQRALAGDDAAVTARASKTEISEDAKKLEKIAARVNMGSAPELIFDLTLKTGTDPNALTASYSYYSLTGKETVSGSIPVTDDRGGNVYRVKLDGFASADMRQPVTVQVLEGENLVYDVITYSLECYCTSMLNAAVTVENRTELEKLQPLCQQMMNYSNAAKEYFVK